MSLNVRDSVAEVKGPNKETRSFLRKIPWPSPELRFKGLV